MAQAKVSVELARSPQQTWDLASDLSRYDQWLTVHEGWRGELPAQIAAGTTATSVVAVKGFRNRVDWTLTQYDPPQSLKLVGAGKGGVKITLDLRISPSKKGSAITMDIDVSGGLVVGPVGFGVSRALKGEVATSLENFAKLD